MHLNNKQTKNTPYKSIMYSRYTRVMVKRVHIPSAIHKSSHDLSVLELEEVEFTNNLRPICLPM